MHAVVIVLAAALAGFPGDSEKPTTVDQILEIANINYEPITVVPREVATQERVRPLAFASYAKTQLTLEAAEKKLAELRERLGVCCQYNAAYPHIPEKCLLEINNQRSTAYRISVNGTEHYLPPGTTKLTVPLGTVQTQLIGYGSPQFRDSHSWAEIDGTKTRTLNIR
jgi:hypothetical protein